MDDEHGAPGPPGPPPAWSPPPPYLPPPDGAPRAPRPRTALVLGLVGALVVIAAAVVVPLVLGRDDADVGTVADPGAPGAAVAGDVDLSNLDAVQVYRGLSREHVTTPITYPQSPPVGGDHYPVWMDCGVYDQPVNDENAVHDLEHGTVWITYTPGAPGLDAAGVARLADALPDNGILSPRDDLPAPVVVTVWGRQLALTGPDDPRLAMFVSTFKDGVTAPEPLASCAGGLTDPAGGLPGVGA